jgi:hypothetical protein
MPFHQPVCREVARSNSILVGAVELVGFSNLGVFDQRSNRVTSVSNKSFQGPLSRSLATPDQPTHAHVRVGAIHDASEVVLVKR